MQNQSHDHEKKSVGEAGIQNKSSFDHGNTSLFNYRRQSSKSNRLSAHTEIKQFNSLWPEILEHRESLLDIRPTRQSLKISNSTDEQSSLITINVGGNRFQTYLSTLQLYPDTLLGNEEKRKPYWNSNIQEYFFDRHRACFESILYYYQSNGRLRRPDFVPVDTFLEEISFFELGSEASDQVRKSENISAVEQIQMPRMLWRRYIWFYFEFPQHSLLARLINVLSLFLTIVSCIALAIETLPTYNHHWEDICKVEANISLNSTYVPRCSATFASPFFIIQSICVAYFTVEFFLRLISTPSYFQFLISFFNWVDLAAIVPYFVFLIIQLSEPNLDFNANAVLAIRLLRVIRFARIFKIYLVFGKLKTLRVLSSTIKESTMDFLVMICILTLIAFLFGAATYFAEQEMNGDVFDSIPKATYWGIITITGVGYGDMYPITTVGRIFTCLCALVGAGMMGMLVSVLVDRYQRVNNRKMYIPEPEISPVELRRLSSSRSESETSFSSRKSSRIRNMSSAISHQLSLVHKKLKHDRRRSSPQSYKVQFIVSFDGEDIENNNADKIVDTMKEKLTEVVSDAPNGIHLKVIDNKKKKVWTTFGSGSSRGSTSHLITASNHENTEKLRSQAF